MRRPKEILREAAARLDVAGAIGAGLATFGVLLFLSAIVPAREEIGRLRAQLARARVTPEHSPSSSEAAERGRSQLAAFTRSYPTLREAPGLILRMHQIAARHDLTLDTGEYRFTEAADSGFGRYQISLPLHGGYTQVRAFVDEVLAQIPAAALDEVTITRNSVAAESIETRVRMTLYLAGSR